MLRVVLVVNLSLFVAVVVEPAARACSPPLSGYIAERTVLPFDGSTEVPTNARVFVTYRGMASPYTDSPRLRVATGAGVAASVTWLSDAAAIQRGTFLIQPASPLQPNTAYQVLSTVAQTPCMANAYWASYYPYPPCNPVPDGGVGASDAGDAGAGSAILTVISTFTTGAGPDTTPPVLSGSLTHSSQKQDCPNSACCGPYAGYTVYFNWQDASDTSIVYYELAQGGSTVLSAYSLATVGTIPPGKVVGEFVCSGMGSMALGGLFRGVAGTYALVAVDLAGNRSGAITDQVTIDCSAFYDGGTAPDSSPVVDLRADVPLPVDTAPDAAVDSIDGTTAARPDVGTFDTGTDGSPAVDARADAPILVGDAPILDDAAPEAAVAGIDGTAAVGSDAGIYDASTTQPARSDASIDASEPAGPVLAKGSSGCSCRLAGHGSGVNGLGIAAFALLLVLRGRRRLR